MSTAVLPGTDAVRAAGADAPGVTDDDERARRIRSAVRARSQELRSRHRLLGHQDAIGATLLGLSAAVVVAAGVAYAAGWLPWWVTIPLAAFAMSIAHEIEHDQIHRLYFARNPKAQNVVLATCWLLRPYTISPWARRPLHLLHHKVSGTKGDIEERGITNGEPWNLKRALMMVDPVAASMLRLPRRPEVRRVFLRSIAKAYFPLTYVALGLWYSFLGLNATQIVGHALGASVVPLGLLHVVNLLAVAWIIPNVLRVTCLHFISSNMHYYGDVEEGNVVQQTQVLNRWYLAPLQLFCANFGSTHGIHHFVPSDPFYVRQLTAPVGHEAMRANGVRFNDLGTLRRANRYHAADAA